MLNRLLTIAAKSDGTLTLVRIEGDVRPGLPGITLVGLSGDLRAACDDVREVLATLAIRVPQRRMVFHASPAWEPKAAELYVPMIAAVLAGCVNHDFRGRDIVAVPERFAGPEADELVRIFGGQAVNVPANNNAEAVLTLIQAAASRIGKTPL